MSTDGTITTGAPPTAGTPPAAPNATPDGKSSIPVPNPLTAAELVDVLIHPLRTIEGFFSWGKNILAFDALGSITSQNAQQAVVDLNAANKGMTTAVLERIFPFMGRAIDRRAATAITQLRPNIEQGLSTRVNHPVNIVWPVGGSNLSALDELMTFDATFKGYPDATIQKTLAGIAEIDVQRLDLWDMANPIKHQAATLFIQRPITWIPGQHPIDESLKAYMDAQSRVSAQM